MINSPSREEWEIDFDKRFPEFIGIGASFPIFNDTPNRNHIKNFIRELLLSQDKELRDKPKCEDIGFTHAWQDITSNIVFPTYPPQYPNRKRRCLNCGKEEELKTIQQEITEWK